MKFYRIYKNIYRINFKSIFFNFKYFDFSTAIKLPILIDSKTKFFIKKGIIILPKDIRFGMIKFGYGGSFFDLKDKKSVWQLKGQIIFKGSASFGNGTTISVLENSKLIIGDNFRAGSNCKFLSRKQIEFGANCLLSWNITIMDTDFHAVLNHKNEIINLPQRISIHNNVWIGCHSTILKGVEIGNNSVVAGNSVISKSESKNNVIIASSKQQIIKENIKWKA